MRGWSRFFLFLAFVFSLWASSEHPSFAQFAPTGEGVNTGQTVTAVMQTERVAPTDEQLRLQKQWEAQKRPPGPSIPTGAESRRESPEMPASPAPRAVPNAAPEAPGDFTVFRTKQQAPFAGGSKSEVNEPSLGVSGSVVFVTSNWDAGVSTDGGQNFSFVNPYNTFPSLDGGFCCDQTAIYAASHDLFAWSLQYVKSGSLSTSTGGWRTAFASSANAAAGNWCYYTWHPDNFGLSATGLWMDYPDVAISNGFVYYQVNIFTTTTSTWQRTVIWRIPLSQVQTCSTINYSYFVVSDRFTFSLVQGATDTMYFASHNSTSSIRIYNWPDSSSTVGWNDVAVTTWYDGTRVCTAPDGSNPCGRADGAHGMTGWVSGGVIGFMWSSSSGGSRPYPYIRVARFNESTKALINEPDVWNSNGAFIYNAAAINARGHLAGTLFFAGGGYYPYSALFIWDDLSAAPAPWELYYQLQSGAGTSSRWGDYYATRRHGGNPYTWASVNEVKLAGGTINTVYQWYGRQRDSGATLARVPHDFNADGKSDVLWRGPSGEVAEWLLNGATLLSGPLVAGAPLSWTIAATGDFDGDGKGDVLWRGPNGEVAIWFLNGSTITSGPLIGVVSLGWTIVGTGDFNGDGKSDVLWRGPNGEVAIWQMNGASIASGPLVGVVSLGWTIAATGDLNGDGKSDIVWRGPGSEVALWTMNGSAVTSSPLISFVGSAWTISGAGDLNGDGKSDIIWRGPSGEVAVWIMNGSTITNSPVVAVPSLSWTIAGTGDFNGDGKSDILWRGPGGEVALWLMNGVAISSGPVVAGAPLSWLIQGMR